jgi:hypothetical protein
MVTSHTAVWRSVCENKLYPFHEQPGKVRFQVLTAASMKLKIFWDVLPWWWRQHAPLKRRSTSNYEHGSTSQKILSFKAGKGLQQGTNICVHFPGWALRKTVHTTQCLCSGEAWRNAFKPRKLEFAPTWLIAFKWLLQTSYLDKHFSSGAQFDVTVRRVLRRKDTSNSCCDYVQRIQSAGKSSPHEQEALKTDDWSDDWKNSTKCRIIFVSLQQRNKLTLYVKKNCFHFKKFGNHKNKSDINVKTP